MSDRERWIVYPLLFFSLVLGFRHALTEKLRCRTIECQQLHVQSINNAAYPPATTVIVTPGLTSTAPPATPLTAGAPTAESPAAAPVQDTKTPSPPAQESSNKSAP